PARIEAGDERYRRIRGCYATDRLAWQFAAEEEGQIQSRHLGIGWRRDQGDGKTFYEGGAVRWPFWKCGCHPTARVRLIATRGFPVRPTLRFSHSLQQKGGGTCMPGRRELGARNKHF